MHVEQGSDYPRWRIPSILAVFYWLDQKGNVNEVVGCHVDDFIWGGTTDLADTLISHIKDALQVTKSLFPVVSLGHGSEKIFLGLKTSFPVDCPGCP